MRLKKQTKNTSEIMKGGGGQFYNHTPMGSLEGPALTRGSSRLKDRSDKFRINIF